VNEKKDGYVIVRSNSGRGWFRGHKDRIAVQYTKQKSRARRFVSQADFRDYFESVFGVPYRRAWGDHHVVTFVRVRPRSEESR
jgi:hypothetical protein